MRWLRCSYQDMMDLPRDYVEVAADMARRESKSQARSRG